MARKFLVVIQRHDCLSPWCILRNFLHEKKHWLQKGKLRVGVERKKKRLSVATGRHCHFMPNEKKYFDVIGQHHQSFETALRASSGRTAVIFVMYRDYWHKIRDKSIIFTYTYRSEERRVGKEGRSRWSPYH